MVLNVLSVKEASYVSNYDIEAIYDTEVLQPNQLHITIYEVSLKEDDKLQIQENESYIPYPTLRNQYGTSFRIDPQKYDFKKISQFDNRKFLLVLYNKEKLRVEIFFDTAQRLAQNFKSRSIINPFKTLNADENFLIAINEPKGLLAIYNTKEAKLNVFSFDDNRSRLYGRNANIQLLKCNVLSSPDGSCIMAFTKDKPEEDNPIIFNYKVIDLPLNFKSLEFLQISCIDNRQTHLISLDLQNGCLNSLLVTITLEKTQFHFQKCTPKKSPTLQRTKLNDFINAYKLMFEKYPIDGCIDPKQNCPLSLRVVLDTNIEEYGKEFEKYINKMFKNLKRSTKKPASSLNEFSISVITFQELDVGNANFQKTFHQNIF
ncbi:unnamed protein product [Rhizophagus irregularis]|nr:unnamed protein product [Rhizophagus irregularis]